MDLTLSEIKKLRVVDLRARLSELGLPTSGLKADLVDRLYSYYQQQSLEINQEEDEFDDPQIMSGVGEPSDIQAPALHPPPIKSPPIQSPPIPPPPMQPPPMQPPPMQPPPMQPPPMQRPPMQPPPMQRPPMQRPPMQRPPMQPPPMQPPPISTSPIQSHLIPPPPMQPPPMQPPLSEFAQAHSVPFPPPAQQMPSLTPIQLQLQQLSSQAPIQPPSPPVLPPPSLTVPSQVPGEQPVDSQPDLKGQASLDPPQSLQPSHMLLLSGPVSGGMSLPPPRPPPMPVSTPPVQSTMATQSTSVEPPSLPPPFPPPHVMPTLPVSVPQLSLPPSTMPAEDPMSRQSPLPPPPPPPPPQPQQQITEADMMEIRQVQEREKQEREKQEREAAEVARIEREQQDLIEREKQRILQQQQERIRHRQEQQRLEDEKMQKALQQQKMLEDQRKAQELDEETRQKVVQQQILIEQQRVAEETFKEADLLREQHRALAVQREEEEKIRQQQEMLKREAEQQRGQQHGMGGLRPTPPSGGPPQTLISSDIPGPPRPPPRFNAPMGPGPREPQPRPVFPEPRGPHDRLRMPLRHGRGSDSRHPMVRGRFERVHPHMMDKGHPPPIMESGGPPRMDDDQPLKDIRLPQALEKVLAFKDKRIQQVGSEGDEVVKADLFPPQGDYDIPDIDADNEEEDEDDEDGDDGFMEEAKKPQPNKQKMSKNQCRKLKKKKRKAAKRVEQQRVADEDKMRREQELRDEMKKGKKKEEKVDVEYVPEQVEIDDPALRQFQRIFQAFQLSEPHKPDTRDKEREEEKAAAEKQREKEKKEEDDDSEEDSDMEDDDDKPKISKKKLRKLNRLSVAELKQLVIRPDVVEMHDVTARDPKLLVYLKAYRNTVPVPRHWCFKRKYLQGKRGIIKPPFELPEFIQRTGIMEMRQALQEKEEQQTMKTKMRQKVRPKMGKIDIDYQKLHDAFFRWQTKPKMTIHGDLYYEGKEFETKLKEKKPGELTDELKTSLGMPTGQNADKYPPPWLIAMQRYGPPPSYPHLKIQGLNSPIPESCSFGYHAGGWGKPPVDQSGKPLYGNVFGTATEDLKAEEEEEVDKTQWGELESESEESSSEEESEEEREAGEIDETGLITPADGGLITPSGLTSIPTGMETPDMIELRKKKIEDAMEQGAETPQLYTVIPEKKTNVGGAMVGSAHVYDLPAAGTKKQAGTASEGVAIALDPSELDLDTEAMTAKYEEQVREQQSQLETEDFSDMVAEHAAKQKNKRKKQTQDTGRAAKKYKEFKF